MCGCMTHQSLKSDTQGLTTVEYIILLFCVVIPAIAAWQGLHCEIDSKVGLAAWEVSHSLGR